MSLPFMRKIDKRNAFYGVYKYQVRTSRMKEMSFKVRDWCSKTFGPELEWFTLSNNSSCQIHNPRWRTHHRHRWGGPHIYLATDAEATLFNLRWAKGG